MLRVGLDSLASPTHFAGSNGFILSYNSFLSLWKFVYYVSKLNIVFLNWILGLLGINVFLANQLALSQFNFNTGIRGCGAGLTTARGCCFPSRIETVNFTLNLLLDNLYKNSNTFIPNYGRGLLDTIHQKWESISGIEKIFLKLNK